MKLSKTKVFAAIWAVIALATAQGWIHLTPECIETLKAILGAGVAFGIRDALGRIGA